MTERFSERRSAKLAWFRLSLPHGWRPFRSACRASVRARPPAGGRAPRSAPRLRGARSRVRRAAAPRAACRETMPARKPSSAARTQRPRARIAIPAMIDAKRSAARASALLWVAADSHLREPFSLRSKTLRSAWNWSRKVGPHGLAQSAIPYSASVRARWSGVAAGRRLAEIVALKARHHLDQAQVLIAPADRNSAPQLGGQRLAVCFEEQKDSPSGYTPESSARAEPGPYRRCSACCASLRLLSCAAGFTIRSRPPQSIQAAKAFRRPDCNPV